MAKKTYEEYLADAHITPEPKSDFRKDMDKYAPAIKAGMEAAKKRNKELLDKRNASESEGKAPKTHRTIEEESMKPQSTQTEVKASKGGYVEAETREKPKVKRGTTTTSTKGMPSTVSTTTSTRGQSGSTGGANASTKGTPPSAAEQEYYKTAGANKEARGHKEGIRLGGPNYGRLKINAIKREKRFSEAWKAVFKNKKGLISYKNAKY